MNQFGKHVQLVVDNTKIRVVMKLPTNLGAMEDGRILGRVRGQKTLID
jgi:hypothetical protein